MIGEVIEINYQLYARLHNNFHRTYHTYILGDNLAVNSLGCWRDFGDPKYINGELVIVDSYTIPFRTKEDLITYIVSLELKNRTKRTEAEKHQVPYEEIKEWRRENNYGKTNQNIKMRNRYLAIQKIKENINGSKV